MLPHWRILSEYSRCVQRAAIPAGERAACYAALTRWVGIHMNWARLLADLVIAAYPSCWRFLHALTVAASSFSKRAGRGAFERAAGLALTLRNIPRIGAQRAGSRSLTRYLSQHP